MSEAYLTGTKLTNYAKKIINKLHFCANCHANMSMRIELNTMIMRIQFEQYYDLMQTISGYQTYPLVALPRAIFGTG